MSPTTAIFWPMMAHVLLVTVIYRYLFSKRVSAVKSGQAKIEAFRIKGQEPDASAQARASLENQFEMPMLFHIACLSLYVTGLATLYPVLLAWAFVISRYVHAWIHLTRNRIRHRLPVFASGGAILLLMWLWLAIGLAVN